MTIRRLSCFYLLCLIVAGEGLVAGMSGEIELAKVTEQTKIMGLWARLNDFCSDIEKLSMNRGMPLDVNCVKELDAILTVYESWPINLHKALRVAGWSFFYNYFTRICGLLKKIDEVAREYPGATDSKWKSRMEVANKIFKTQTDLFNQNS